MKVWHKETVKHKHQNVAQGRDTELKSFLGLQNYYSQFLENPFTILQPLHDLLRENSKWNLTKDCDEAFKGYAVFAGE